jgi:hypothetical protein
VNYATIRTRSKLIMSTETKKAMDAMFALSPPQLTMAAKLTNYLTADRAIEIAGKLDDHVIPTDELMDEIVRSEKYGSK